MLRLVLLASTLTGHCRADADNSSLSPSLLSPAPAAAQAHSLRRQLLRDNYDYQHEADESQPNSTAGSGGDTKFYYQKGGIDHLPRSSELARENSNEFSAESGQQQHYKQRNQLEQRGQHEQGGQYKQNGEYEHRSQHKQGRHHKQPGEYEHRDQYQQPGEHEQRGQYEQHDQYEQYGPHKQRGERKHHGQHQNREQREQRGPNEQRGPHEQRGQNENSEQQEQLEQFDEQEQAQSIGHKLRTAPSLDDAPVTLPVAVPFTDELTVRDVFEREYTPDRGDIKPDQAKEYNPSYYNKRRDEYEPSYPAQTHRKPFSDLRGNFKEQNDMRAQGELASNVQESPDQEYAPDEQEAFDQQDASASQDDEESDFSVSKKQPKIENEFVTRSTTRANRLQYYTPAPAERNAPPHRVHSSLSYHDHNPPLHRSHNAPPPHRNAPDHNISKKDLLYYMDDNQLRRRINDASPDVLDEDQPADDQLPSPQRSHSPPARQGRSGGELPPTSRTRRSFVVTVSAANVTYKLLTLKSRSGRRQYERRVLEERGPRGVALVSLDGAPLPALRLPRVRRQYMRRRQPA